MLVLIIVGFVLTKTGTLNKQGVSCMTDVVLYAVTPCIIIKSFIRKFDKSDFKNLLVSFAITLLIHFLLIVISNLVLREKNIERRKVLIFSAVFSNCGFMSLPLQEALLGEDGVFYGAAYIAIFNLLVWSYGIFLMSGDKKYISGKKLVFNPAVIAIIIGFVIFLYSIPLPEIVSQPISYLAGLNTPLPMIIIGFHLANSDFVKILKCGKALFTMSLRLVLFPLLILGILYLFGVRGTMLVSLVISCCAPVAAISTMFSAKFGADTELSAGMVSFSTVVSVVTIPIIVTLSQMIA